MALKKVDRLRRKMDNICIITTKLLTAQPRPNRSIWEHIAKLEELIIELLGEDDVAPLVDSYRNKVVNYWQQFEHGEMPAVSGFWSPGPPFRGVKCFGPRPLLPFGRETGRLTGEQNTLLEPPPTAEAIYVTLKAAFDRLAPVKSLKEDLEGMKNLLMLVTKARAITMSHWKNVRLLSDIFSMAFAKLPPVLQKVYREEYNGEKKWLRDLRNFIQDEIDYFSMEHLNQKQNGLGGDSVLRKQTTCYFCKLQGHHLNKCPVLANYLCAKCFSFANHTEIRCRNPMVFIRLTDI